MYIYTKATVRKKAMRQDNFRKRSRCHYFSEVFQWVLNRWRNTNLIFFLKSHIQNHFKNGKYRISQIYHKHKIREVINCDMTKAPERDFSEKHYPN